MNEATLEARVREVFKDKAYVSHLLKLEKPEEVQASLKEKGIDLSIESLIKIRKMLLKAEREELTDEELESVAGGGLGIAFLVGTIIGVIGGAGAIVTSSQTEGRW